MTELYYPKCYALVSGGKDSLSTAQALDRAGKLEACVALETGLSTPDWKEFVMRVCDERGWRLEFYRTPSSYDELVVRYGFPGPAMHNIFMSYLKGRCVRQFKKARPAAVLASGVRSGESVRRAGTLRPVGLWENVPILAPIYQWTTDETWAYFREHGFERAPAYSTLQISGDCLCGSFAREDEVSALRFHYPEIAARFDGLTEEIKTTHPKRSQWGWGWNRPREKGKRERFLCVECGDTQPDLFAEVTKTTLPVRNV